VKRGVVKGWDGSGRTKGRRWVTRACHWLEMTDSIASPKPRKYEGSNESDWMIYPARGGEGLDLHG
jgi:hypothetical protein